jgi:tRNA pseudouridine38-40 synthase
MELIHVWGEIGFDVVIDQGHNILLALGRGQYRGHAVLLDNPVEKTGGNNATSICTITEAGWETYRPTHVELMGYQYREGDYIVFRIKANRFLRNMVRAIVGSLVEVGRGKREPQWIADLIAKGNRSDAGSSVPGKALFFTGAEY